MNAITSRWGRRFYASMVAQACTPAMINYFCRRFVKTLPAKKDADEMEELYEHLIKIKPLVLPEHRESGLVFLSRMARDKKWGDQFNRFDREVMSGIAEIRWADTYEVFTGIGRQDDCRPVYEVRAKGMHFRYFMRPWQSGFHFEVTRNARPV